MSLFPKRHFFFALVCSLLLLLSNACSDSSPTVLSAAPVFDTTTFVQENYAAFGRGEIETVLNNMSDDIIWESRYSPDLPFSGEFVGKEGVGQYLQAVGESLEITEFSPQEFVAQDNVVAVFGFERARVLSTDKVYINRWAHRWQIEDGEIFRITTYNDSAAVAEAFNPLA
jgi:hypothetical protein